VDGLDHVHVVWYDALPWDDNLYYKMFDGSLWGSTETLTSARYLYGASLAIDDADAVHVSWHDERYAPETEGAEIIYKMFDGNAWGSDTRITNASDDSYDASIATDDSGYVHLVWADRRDGNREIYYKYFDGRDWSADLRLTRASDASTRPSLAVGPDGALHVVWRESRDGNAEIYYKRRDPAWLAGVSTHDTNLRSDLDLDLRILPNPVHADASVLFQIPSEARAAVAIYDIRGRQVWEENLGRVTGGEHHIHWKGTDRNGRLLAPGIYLARITAGGRTATSRIVVLR
jgi:hypothetical protein